MAWLISLLGAALAIAGAASLASGFSYMPIEWGWTEIIAGTTALSAGIVTIALGAVLLGLSSLRRSLETSVSVSPDAGLDAAVTMGTPAEHIAPLAPVEAQNGQTGAHAAPVPAMPEDAGMAPPPAIDSPIVPDVALADEIGTLSTPARQAPRRQPLFAQLKGRWGGRDKPSAQTTTEAGEPKFATLDAPTVPPEMEMPAEASGFSRGLSEEPNPDHVGPDTRSATHDQAGDSQSEQDAIRADHSDRWIGSGIAAAPPTKPAAAEPGLATPFHRVGIEDLPPAPTEVGRYEAGGASYALFSDGTIEVETETGLHRFGSMEELKDFIEHQEKARSGPDR